MIEPKRVLRALAEHWALLEPLCERFDQGTLSLAELRLHSWPGNVRELRNAIERAVILGSGEILDKNDLPGSIIPATAALKIGDMVPLATIEELHIRRVMASSSSLQDAADVLGIDQATLWRRRKTYGI